MSEPDGTSSTLHYSMTLATGETIAGPAEDWLNQPLVRLMIFVATGGTLIPEFTDDKWFEIIATLVAAAEEVNA
jgi:hypothetical protein